MLDFFMGLFGGLYYLGRYAAETAKDMEYDRSKAEYKAKLEKTKELYGVERNTEERKALEQYVLCGENYDEICNKYEEDFRYVFGEDWRKRISLPHEIFTRNNPTKHSEWVIRLMLADKGKMQMEDIWGGVKADGHVGESENIKFCRCVEQRLRKNGYPDAKFVVNRGEETRFYKNLYLEDTRFSSYSGVRLWED